MTERWKRPDIEQLSAAYQHIFKSNTLLSKVKDAAFNGRLFNLSNSEQCVPGRSMAWKLFLIPVAPLTPPAEQFRAKAPIDALNTRRREYVSLLLEKMRMPDGSYEEGFSPPGTGSAEQRRASSESSPNLQMNNPLSLHEDNPWNDWFASVDLRRTIRQDVERTFPDIEYFRDSDVQSQLTDILYIHSVLNPVVGYRQGMHELLAPLYYAIDVDSVSTESDVDSDLREFCSRTWVAADAWALFTVIMDGIGSWYEWREPTLPPLPTPLRTQFHHDNSGGEPSRLQPYVAPIVLACQELQAQYLKNADPMLWQGMQKAGIEPQIYGIRWLRLLFTREFSLPDAMVLWDGLFSNEGTFELVPWICVAMLIRIRNQLIPSDYTGQLTFLLRYPPPPQVVDPTTPNHATILLRQAYALYTSPNASTGASISIENRNLLNIPLDVPEVTQSPRRSTQRAERNRRASSAERTRSRVDGRDFPSRNQRERPSQSVQLGLPELIARGLLERSETLGINKTVMNAVSEIRKNLPDLASQLIRTPPPESSSLSSFPMVDERPQEERPPWEPRTRFEMENEISELRNLQKKLGSAIGVAVDALLQDEDGGRDESTLKKIKERKREALESLAYMRDILSGSTTEVDDERLFGEEEYKRRKAQTQARSSPPQSLSPSPQLTTLKAPEPVATPQAVGIEHRDRTSPQVPSHPRATLPRSPPVFRSSQEPSSGRHAATLPRRVNLPTSNAGIAPTHAPWNYTRSHFSTPSLVSPDLPRPPPTTSTLVARTTTTNLTVASSQSQPQSGQTPRQSQTSADPLGVLP